MPVEEASFGEVRILGYDDESLCSWIIPDRLIVGLHESRVDYMFNLIVYLRKGP